MTTAILPIRPNYVNEILSGNKRVEFRRTRFKRDVTNILIYASTPVKRIVGYFEVGDILEMSPEQAWLEFESDGGIDYKSFFDYYEGASVAYVISICEVVRFENEIMLTELCENLAAPQSYRYLSNELFSKAKDISGC
jgi:predicted transcriptional regulator